jgi:arginine repressor
MVKMSESGLPDVLSAIAGHGAVWVATRTVTQAKALVAQISALRSQ